MIEYLFLLGRNLGQGPFGFFAELADRSAHALQQLLGSIGGYASWVIRYLYALVVNNPYYVLIGLTLIVVMLVFSSIARR